MKRGTIFAILGILVLLGGVGAGIYLVSQQQLFQQKAAPASSLTMTPASMTKPAGSDFTFTVNMSTGTNAVTAVNIVVNFNPNIMQIVSVSKGSGITNLSNKITDTFDNAAGTITFSYFTLDPTQAVSGTGLPIMTVNASVKAGAANGNYNIAFDPSTSASASQEGQNVIISKSGAVLTVGGSSTASPSPTPGGGSPSPSPTPGGSATPTPTPTDTSEATSTPGPTLTPRPIPVTGVEWPTILSVGVGAAVIIGSILLAL